MDELELEDALEELDRRFYDLEVSTDADTLLNQGTRAVTAKQMVGGYSNRPETS